MERKVNKVGQNTLTVSLPVKWVNKNKIKAGEELSVFSEGSNLRIVSKSSKKHIKRVILNTDNFNKPILNRHLEEFYMQGVEEIIINFTKEDILDYKHNKKEKIHRYMKKILERFIGLEIVSQSTNQIIIQSLITKEEYEKMNVIQNRIYFLIKEFLQEFIKSMNYDFNKFHDKSYSYHDNITKFLIYYLRLLHFSDINEIKKMRLFGLFLMIDKIMDKVRHTSERVNEMKSISKKIKGYLEDIFNLFIEQFNLILKKKCPIDELNSLVKKRYDLVKKVELEKFNDEEHKGISNSLIILDTINEFSGAYIALHVDRYLEEN